MTHAPTYPRSLNVAVVAVAALLLVPSSGLAQAEQPPPPSTGFGKQATPAIGYRERPRYPVDPQRLKLRPKIDGEIGDNEWTPLYTVTDGAVKGTVYVNWDDDNLYVAARTDGPAWVAFDLDANADGWLRGADNLEIVVGPPAAEGAAPQVIARVLDASTGRDVPVWNDKVVDPKNLNIAFKNSPTGEVLEMAIPKGTVGLVPRRNAVMACRCDFLPVTAVPTPTAPYEPHLLVDITLVEERGTGAGGLSPRLLLNDNKLVPEQTLYTTLELINQVEDEMRVRSITWQGDGAAADILKTLKEVAVQPIKGLKTLKLKYSSPLPVTTVPGFYQLTATAQLENGSTVTATATFSVVEAVSAQVDIEPESVVVLGPTPIKAFVGIANASSGFMRGDVEIEAPAGWEVKGRTKKTYSIQREDGVTREPFYITLPSTTQAGDYIVNATVSWHGRTWKAHRSIHVIRGSGAAPEPAAPKKP